MSRRRTILTAVVGLGLAGVLLLGMLNAYVMVRGRGATHDVASVQHAQVAIVPGALVPWSSPTAS